MAADLQWRISENSIADWSGGAVTSLRFRNGNYNTTGAADPLIRPTSGTNYSYEKATMAYVFGDPDTQLSNLRFKIDQSDIGNWSGLGDGTIRHMYRLDASYTQPQAYSGGTGGVGGPMSGIELSTAEVTWTGASTLETGVWNSGSGAPAVWENAQFLYHQMEIDPGQGGTLTQYNLIMVYNEI